jgi:esterase/lipase
LESYAHRLAAVIDISQPFYLIGLSLGGIIATEISKMLFPKKTILISSVCRYSELPLLYRVGGKLRLQKLIIRQARNSANGFLYWLFGLTKQQDKKMLKQVMADSDANFTTWAMDAVTKWRNEQIPPKIIRIHGNKDRVLPITSFTPDYIIQEGGHLMVVNRAREISSLLKTLLVN